MARCQAKFGTGNNLSEEKTIVRRKDMYHILQKKKSQTKPKQKLHFNKINKIELVLAILIVMANSNWTLNRYQATYLTHCSVYFKQPFSQMGTTLGSTF